MQPKKLVLDYSKWRSGGDSGPNKVGLGPTLLLNDEGFSCCLGQWLLQSGAPKEMIESVGEPSELKVRYPPFNYSNLPSESLATWNTPLANKCIYINDDDETPPEQKIYLLRAELAKEGIELEVINKP